MSHYTYTLLLVDIPNSSMSRYTYISLLVDIPNGLMYHYTCISLLVDITNSLMSHYTYTLLPVDIPVCFINALWLQFSRIRMLRDGVGLYFRPSCPLPDNMGSCGVKEPHCWHNQHSSVAGMVTETVSACSEGPTSLLPVRECPECPPLELPHKPHPLLSTNSPFRLSLVTFVLTFQRLSQSRSRSHHFIRHLTQHTGLLQLRREDFSVRTPLCITDWTFSKTHNFTIIEGSSSNGRRTYRTEMRVKSLTSRVITSALWHNSPRIP
jgi:hypothetical protein